MIKWREGKAGFVGNSKRLIKGIFSYVYTVTTDLAIILSITDGVVSTMTSDGHGTTGLITSDGSGVLSLMANSGIISSMTDYGDYALSTINSDGDGIDSTM